LRLKEVGAFEAQSFFLNPDFKCKINFHLQQNAANLF
jgi:hypothetical protein